MTKSLVFSLCLLLVFNGCLAARQQSQQQRKQNECQLNQLQAREPSNSIRAEAGKIETWNHNEDDFQCAGVAAERITIERNGLHVPAYSNAPQLIYVVQGSGVLGVAFPGCPETFEEYKDQPQQQFQRGGQGQREQQKQQEEQQRGRQEQQGQQGRQQQGQQQQGQQGQQEQQDRHQKVRRIRAGDVIVIPAGVAFWTYNDGDQELVKVILLDVSNDHNQLDQNPRKFYLAGNPENEFEQQGQSQHRQPRQFGQGGKREQQGQQGRQQQQQQEGRQQQQGHGQQQQGSSNNVFSGMNTQLLAQALKIDEETARSLQGSENDNRNQIIQVRGQLDFLQPPRGRQQREHEEREQRQVEQERRQQGGQQGLVAANGLEETFCSMRLIEHIGNPQRADVYSPQAGRISTLNSLNLPILSAVQLSAERGFFYSNCIYTPHWNINAHSVVYVIRGSARVQIVNENGNQILDDQVQKGQLFIVPQNHGVISQAGNEGFEYIAFKTNDNAMISTLAGRTSLLRALPLEVLTNAYQIERQQAQQIKYNRLESIVLSSSQSFQRRAVA